MTSDALAVEELGESDHYAGGHAGRPNYPSHQASFNFHHARLNFGNALVKGAVLPLVLQRVMMEPRGDAVAWFGLRLHCHALFPYFGTQSG